MMMDTRKELIDLIDLIETEDDIKKIRKKAKKIGDRVKAEYILEAWKKSDKSYEEMMIFLKSDTELR